MIKHILTEEDFTANPELHEVGLKVGDEIEFPAPAVTANSDSPIGGPGGRPDDRNPPPKPPQP